MANTHDSTGPAGPKDQMRRGFSPAASAIATISITLSSPAARDDWEEQIIEHAEAILDLMRANLPAGASVQGFQFFCADNQMVPDSICGSALIAGGGQIAQCRPTVFMGWKSNGGIL